MIKKTPAKPAKPAADRLAKTNASSVELSDAQLDQVRGGLNYTKITYNTAP